MKICKVPECNRFVFARGYCDRHQHLRTDKSPAKIKKSPLRAVFKPTGEKILFDTIIATRPHKSQLSGKPIHNPGPANCAHLWSKKQHPEFRLLDINICLLTFEEHHLFDQGTKAQREKYAIENNCDWDLLERFKEAVIQSQ